MKFTIFHLLIIIMILMFRAFSLMRKYILYTFIVPLTLYPQFFILGVIQSMEEAQWWKFLWKEYPTEEYFQKTYDAFLRHNWLSIIPPMKTASQILKWVSIYSWISLDQFSIVSTWDLAWTTCSTLKATFIPYIKQFKTKLENSFIICLWSSIMVLESQMVRRAFDCIRQNIQKSDSNSMIFFFNISCYHHGLGVILQQDLSRKSR